MTTPNRDELNKMVEESANLYVSKWDCEPLVQARGKFDYKSGAQLIIDGPLAEAEKRIDSIEFNLNHTKSNLEKAIEYNHKLAENSRVQLTEAQKIVTEERISFAGIIVDLQEKLRINTISDAENKIAQLSSRVQELIHMPEKEFQKQCLSEVSVALKISAESEAKLAEAQKDTQRLAEEIVTLRANKSVCFHAEEDTQRLEWMISKSHMAVWENGIFNTLNFCSSPREIIDAAMKEGK